MVFGTVHSFETLGTLDGPGIRFIVFLSGCTLRCKYCHNPDTWDRRSGDKQSSEDIVGRAKKYKPYYSSNGGITLSGGEPLLQPEFAAEIMRCCHEEGINTCVDTSGSVLNDKVKDALSHADLLLLDIKHTDTEKYKELTGGNIQNQRAFLDYCKSIGMPLWIRRVVLPDTTREDIYALMEYIKGANVKKVELLPYHTLGAHKWKELGMEYSLEGVEPPSDELMTRLRAAVEDCYVK